MVLLTYQSSLMVYVMITIEHLAMEIKPRQTSKSLSPRHAESYMCMNEMVGQVCVMNSCMEWSDTKLYLMTFYYITERSVRWYYGFSIAAASASARRPWRRERYPPITRYNCVHSQRHSYPPNLQNAISP